MYRIAIRTDKFGAWYIKGSHVITSIITKRENIVELTIRAQIFQIDNFSNKNDE